MFSSVKDVFHLHVKCTQIIKRSAKVHTFKTCTCNVDVWMDIICIDVNGLQFVLQDWNVHSGR